MPSAVYALTPDQRRHVAEKKRKLFERSQFTDEEKWTLVGTGTVLAWLGAMREYLSFKHAVTFCKRCAFLWDLEGWRPCGRCGRLRRPFHVLGLLWNAALDDGTPSDATTMAATGVALEERFTRGIDR